MSKIVFGIDIGGTTIKCGYFDKEGALLNKTEIPTRTENNGEYILGDIADYIKGVLESRGQAVQDLLGIGLAVPGSVTEDGVVNGCVNLGWGVFNVADKLSDILDVPSEWIRVGNDANLAALGEFWQGGGKEYNSLCMITVGTGVGGGLILNGKPVVGFNGAAAEIGHMPIVEGLDFKCNCGKTGCLEQVASATGIARLGGKSNAKEVFDAAKNGDETQIAVIDKVSMYLGKALANISAVVDPECFIIGGGVSLAGDFFTDRIKYYYKLNAFYPSRDNSIVAATLGNDAGMYGAAKLVTDI